MVGQFGKGTDANVECIVIITCITITQWIYVARFCDHTSDAL